MIAATPPLGAAPGGSRMKPGPGQAEPLSEQHPAGLRPGLHDRVIIAHTPKAEQGRRSPVSSRQAGASADLLVTPPSTPVSS